MKQDFEGKLRNIVENAEQPVDASAMWRGIEDKMARKKQRKGILWIFFSVGALLVFFILFSIGTELLTAKNQEGVADAPSIEYTAGRDNEHIANSVPLNTSADRVNENRKKRRSVDKAKDENTHQSSAKANVIKNRDNISSSLLSYQELENTQKNESTLVNRQVEIVTDALVAKNLDEGQPDESLPIEAQANEANRIIETRYLSLWQFERLDSDIPSQVTRILVNHEPVVASSAVFGEVGDPPVTMEYMTGITFGLLANQGSKMVANEEQSPYLAARNATESFLDMYSLSAKFELLKWKGLSIRTGLGYNYLTDVFEWEGDIVKEIDKTYLAARIYEVNQGVVDAYDTGLTKVRFQKYVKQYNEQHFINLPVGIAYEHSLYGFMLGIHCDLNFAYRIGNDLKYLQENLLIETRSLPSEWISPYISYGVQLNYPLAKGYEIGFTAERKQFEIVSLKNHYEMWGFGLNLKKNW